jgi:hypothetical protein
VAVSVTGEFGQAETLATVGGIGATPDPSGILFLIPVQPGVLSVTVTEYVPALLTLIELVVSPVLQAYEKGAVPPPEGVAVKTTLLPEQMLGLDEDRLTVNVH